MRQEVLIGPERRRRWSTPEKEQILAEADEAGAVVAEVARRHDVTRQHIYQWRRELRRRVSSASNLPVFMAVEVLEETEASKIPTVSAPVCVEPIGSVELVLKSGRSIRIVGTVDDDLLGRLIRLGETA